MTENARSRPTPSPQWTDEEVMKEIQVAFDRGIEAAELTIDMQKHDAAIRNATLGELIYWLYDVPFRGQDDAGKCHRTLAAKLESLRGGSND